ncbi:MAG: glutathione S-transferase family protein [Sphingomonadales bacterium]|nr:glutathione S-transferase family protein [Sphingomonadales bacterium]
MQVFGGLASPYVRKLCLVLEEKGLAYELVRLNPGSDDPVFRAASPFGKIPGFADGDYRLCDSTAIVTYLEAQYPDRPVLPAEPRARGKAVWFDEFTDTIFAASGLKILFNRFVAPKFLKIPGNEKIALEGEAELPRSLDYVESVAPESGWLLGDAFTLADISVASMCRTLAYVGFDPKAETHPRTAAWYARVRQRPAWQTVAAAEDWRPPRAQ